MYSVFIFLILIDYLYLIFLISIYKQVYHCMEYQEVWDGV